MGVSFSFQYESLSRHIVYVDSMCLPIVSMYLQLMPKLWTKTMKAHRHAVREAILDAAWALAAKRGLASVTMMEVAEKAGIGRATLYKYFPDIETILVAWHRRHVAGHLEHLAKLRDQAHEPSERLKAVLEAYGLISYRRGRHAAELVALLHRGEEVARADHRLRDLVRDLLMDVADAGKVRDDVAPDELAAYCLHSLTAAGSLPSEAAVKRLVRVTLSGLRANASRS
jgi:AcrR family transcriptional regulator